MHRHHHGPPWRYGRTLRGALLASFIAAVVVTGAIVSGIFFVGSERGAWTDDVARVGAWAARGVAGADDPQPVLDETSAAFATRLVLKRGDVVLAQAGAGACRRPVVVDVPGGDHRVIEACRPVPPKPPLRAVVGVVVVVAVLAALSSALARRIAWPLRSLAETARKIGEGDLTARPHIGPYPFVEIRLVGEALAEMAARIERELQGQRALLAGASHELRTPLGHLRILVETARERFDPRHLDEIEKEVLDLDTLLEKLLAQARLDFAHIDRRPVDLKSVARRAAARCGLDDGVVSGDAPLLQGDATLLARAIGNLLENAAGHGGGVKAVVVSTEDGVARVVVDDEGSGVAEADRERIFEPFVHRSDRGKGALGLGLHLVRRIAEAHGGTVFVDDKDGPGARFVLTLPAGAPPA
jgi:signal transduction histidine kinase